MGRTFAKVVFAITLSPVFQFCFLIGNWFMVSASGVGGVVEWWIIGLVDEWIV
jgi:hypothetical protein